MAHLIELPTMSDWRGSLTVFDKAVPFDIKRVYYIHGVPASDIVRGGHRHRETAQALVTVSGSCTVTVYEDGAKVSYRLDSPEKCLVLNPEDWHTMHEFSRDAVLVVLASTHFDAADYIDEDGP